MFRLGVQDRANSGLTTLPSELLLHFTKVNRVHDNDIIGAVFAQKCRRHNSLPGTGKKFADAVRVDVDYVLYLVVHIERRQKCDGFRPGTPENRALPGGGPFAEPA